MITDLRGALQHGFSFAYDYQDQQRARKVLASVERQLGAPAPVAVRREAERYAARVLGSRRFAPWLVVYATMAGDFHEGWIPDNFYGRVVSPNINQTVRHIAEIKSFTRIVFRSNAIPDTGYLINGSYYDLHHRLVGPSAASASIFAGGDDVIVKRDRSRQGKSVSRLSREQFEPEAFAHSAGNAVFQRPITQHPFFDQFTPESSTTLRVTTVRNQRGDYEPRAAYLRFAGQDETFVASASHVRVAVDLPTGDIAEVGYLNDWTRVDRHPAATNRFVRTTLPGFEKALGLCLALHERLPHAGAVGWDVMVDSAEEVWLLEWNAKHNDVKFSEATAGPCFRGLGWESLRPVKGTWLV